ncbi:hypothetical protein DMA11_11695 [Marinilabiliaceae bacterium JC017]|nr:hypothetical protein DMA11_11695 [Marinilabiliaceae bacterium JC017]
MIQIEELQQVQDQLLKIIEVTEPYFALRDVKADNEVVTALVSQELDSKDETRGMSLAEAGRHLAILGSLAVANVNPKKEKHYYLASKATLERKDDNAYDDKEYKGKMTTLSFNRKKAIAQGHLSTLDGKIVYTIIVEYSVLTASLFERMFRLHKQETPKDLFNNPYTQGIDIYDLTTSSTYCSGSLGAIDKKVCVGHFDNYPALPVARISQALVSLAGYNYNANRGKVNETYCVKKVVMDAVSFVFADEVLNIDSTLITSDSATSDYYDTNGVIGKDKHAVNLKCWFY